jgi:hypothetical protein
MNTHYWKEHVNKHFVELKRDYYQGFDESKAVPCPDPRCGLSFDSVDALQYHCQDTQSLNLVKFIPRGSDTSRSIVEEDYESENLPKGLDDKPQVDFVNETVETISSVCVEHFVPKDESGVKGKRGRPKRTAVNHLQHPLLFPETSRAGKEREGGQKGFAI